MSELTNAEANFDRLDRLTNALIEEAVLGRKATEYTDGKLTMEHLESAETHFHQVFSNAECALAAIDALKKEVEKAKAEASKGDSD